MKKRFLSLVLALAVCLSAFATFSVSAETDGPAVAFKTFATYEDALALTNPITGVEENEYFYVTATIKNIMEAKAVVLTLGYDATRVELVDFVNGDAVTLDEGEVSKKFPTDKLPFDPEGRGAYGVAQFDIEVPAISNNQFPDYGIALYKDNSIDVPVPEKGTVTLYWADLFSAYDIQTEKIAAIYRFKAIGEGTAIFDVPYYDESNPTNPYHGRHNKGVSASTQSSGALSYKNFDISLGSVEIASKSLAAPKNVALNERVVTWDAVADAANYTVKVSVTNAEGTFEKSYDVNSNSLTIPAADVEYGKLSVTVVANSNNPDINNSKPSSPAAEGTIYKNLAAPANVKWQETTVNWDPVAGATKYIVELTNGGETVSGYPKEISETSIDVGDDMSKPLTGAYVYVVNITAVGNEEYTKNDNAKASSAPVKFYGNAKSVINPVWVNKTFAQWTANDDVENIRGYQIIVYRNGKEVLPYITTTATSCNLSSYMKEYGTYQFSVIALGKALADGTYGDSVPLASPTIDVATPLSPVTKVEWNDRKITWTDENNGLQSGYEITLYEKAEGETEFTAKKVIKHTDLEKTYDFDKDGLIQVGEYKVSIIALGDNKFHTNSETVCWSDVKEFAERLEAPINVDWNGERTATWTANDARAKSYVVSLLYNGVKTGVSKPSSSTSCVFSENDMALPGEYTFAVQAKAPGYSPSKEVVSDSSQTVNVTRIGNVYIEIFDSAECTAAPAEIKVGTEFYVAVSVEGIGDINAISMPFKFDPHYVKVVDVDGAVMGDVALTKDDVESGEKGIILGSVLEDKISTIIYQSPYPYVDNTKGLVVISANSFGMKNITAKETIAIIKMKAVSMSDTNNVEFGFAVANDDGNPYDATALSGIEFLKSSTHVHANMPTPPVSIQINKGQLEKMAAPVWDTTLLTWTKVEGDHVQGYEIELIKDGTSVATIPVTDADADSLSLTDIVLANGYGLYTAKIRAIGDGMGADNGPWSDESEAYEYRRRNNNSSGGGSGQVIKPDDPKPPVDEKPEFTDIEGHWAEKDIIELADIGIVDGYGDNTFRPDIGITRAEFTKLMVTSLGFEVDADQNEYYEDTAEHWAKDYIAVASELGIVYGIGENLFDPDRIITREQVAAIIHRMASEVETKESEFIDRDDISDYAKPAVDYVAENGIMIGFHDNSFRGQEYTTRAQMATVVLRLMKADFFENCKLVK